MEDVRWKMAEGKWMTLSGCFFVFFLFASQLADAQKLLDRHDRPLPRPFYMMPDPDYPGFVLPELNKPDSDLVHVLRFYEANYSKPLLNLKECVYFFPNQTGNRYCINIRKQKANSFPKADKYSKINHAGRIEEQEEVHHALPSFFRFYADTTIRENLILDSMPIVDPFPYTVTCRKNFRELYTPFYFKKTEITNKEYREFAEWVKDSIARTILAKSGFKSFRLDSSATKGKLILNLKTPLDWHDSIVRKALDSISIPVKERFYRRWEINTDKLTYVFYDKTSEKSHIQLRIPIYPDTLAWIHDFMYSYNEPMTNMYFWHPAYDNYPVVGITKYQAEAYLQWKTEQEQRKLNIRHPDLEIVYSLPTEYEWEMAAASFPVEKSASVFQKGYSLYADRSFLTDLRLGESDSCKQVFSVKRNDTLIQVSSIRRQYMLAREMKSDEVAFGDFMIDGSFHTAPVDFDKVNTYIKNKKKLESGSDYWQYPSGSDVANFYAVNKDDNGICFMGGNVSEWMQESYQDNWKPIYTYRRNLLKRMRGKDLALILSLEEYWNSKCDTNGVLVRGSNWFDERYNHRLGKNTAGMNAKTFADPYKSFSTVGFRYVVHVRRKDEEKVLGLK